jgi:hypothetical protein
MREIIEQGDLGTEILASPASFVRKTPDREHFKTCISDILNDIVVDLNDEIKEYGDDFDYRDKLRDSEWVRNITRTIVKDHLKQINRGRAKGLKEQWELHPKKK